MIAYVFISIGFYGKYTASNTHYLDIIVELAGLTFMIAFLVLAIKELRKFLCLNFTWGHIIWKVIESPPRNFVLPTWDQIGFQVGSG